MPNQDVFGWVQFFEGEAKGFTNFYQWRKIRKGVVMKSLMVAVMMVMVVVSVSMADTRMTTETEVTLSTSVDEYNKIVQSINEWTNDVDDTVWVHRVYTNSWGVQEVYLTTKFGNFSTTINERSIRSAMKVLYEGNGKHYCMKDAVALANTMGYTKNMVVPGSIGIINIGAGEMLTEAYQYNGGMTMSHTITFAHDTGGCIVVNASFDGDL
jgi:hypothetical protein